MKSARIVIFPADPLKAPVCMTIGDKSTGPGWRKLHPGDGEEDQDLWTVLVVPGIEVTARWLHLPTRSEKQALAAARMQMEDELALETEALHLALGPLEKDGYRLVVTVSHEQMRAWIDRAQLYGLKPDILIPDHLGLPEPANGETVAAQMADGVAIVRGPRLAFSCDNDLLPVLLQDRKVMRCNQAAVEGMITEGVFTPALNLLQGEYAVRRHGPFTNRNLIRLAILAGLLLASPVLMHIGQAIHLYMSAQRLQGESAAAAASVMGSKAPVQDPVSSLQGRLRQLDMVSGGPAGRIALFYAAVEVTGDVQLESLTVASDGTLQASLRHAAAADIDKLVAALGRNGIEMRKESSREDAGLMVSDVRLVARP